MLMMNHQTKKKPNQFAHYQQSLISWLLFTLLVLHIDCNNKEDSIESVDISDILRSTPGISNLQELSNHPNDYRFFVFTLSQPVDHFGSDASTFSQTITLLYRSSTAPVVLATTGYDILKTSVDEEESTRLLGANQLTMEHRFFGSSIPNPINWSKLSIEQAAADEHQVVVTFKPIFTGKWLSAGASKGGMTALFHRRFYPNDVDVTLAYVTPLSFSTRDPRYIDFIDSRGDEKTRLAIENWQQAVLRKRNEILPLFQKTNGKNEGYFSLLGANRALEFAVLEAPFSLWQHGNAQIAARVPSVDASPQELYDYLNAVYFGTLKYYWSDNGLFDYQAYFQQSANQLGGPAYKDSHLKGLLMYPGDNVPANYPPMGVDKSYDGGAAMKDIQHWVENSAEKIIFIYGENDPWSAGAVEVTSVAQSRDIRKYIAPAGNHASNLASLTNADRMEAYALLSHWMNATITPHSITEIQLNSLKQKGVMKDHFMMRKTLR